MKNTIQQILNENITKDNHPVLLAESVKGKLVPLLNSLMNTNFNKLVQTLYQLDIDENKILAITKKGSINAMQIADLIIEEKQKIESRRLFHRDYKDDEGLLL